MNNKMSKCGVKLVCSQIFTDINVIVHVNVMAILI